MQATLYERFRVLPDTAETPLMLAVTQVGLTPLKFSARVRWTRYPTPPPQSLLHTLETSH